MCVGAQSLLLLCSRGAYLSWVVTCRIYCARRLRSLYKALKFQHGKGRYQKRKLEIGMITEARCVQSKWAARPPCQGVSPHRQARARWFH
jgi:hypothetical protein